MEFDRMRAQVVWQINGVADCRQVKSAVGWSVSLDEFRLIPLLREFDFKSGICSPGNACLRSIPFNCNAFLPFVRSWSAWRRDGNVHKFAFASLLIRYPSVEDQPGQSGDRRESFSSACVASRLPHAVIWHATYFGFLVSISRHVDFN
ncbi:hypothetical protein [Rhizobium laguerreae]|uniref:hypothetical protein n=1 Tax=Rhizobium laguerreae TaxID=1076926 RepID=UPI001C913C77|nr:hypothetical protein [Rhizobium laguerreae]MBY3371455.1 hypothetical protein [Rhizobium laguerreae]MBY3435201.1 hypothetical protein [Rhizobium laguerreae]